MNDARRAMPSAVRSQAFWISLAVASIAVVLTFATESFSSGDNLFNVSRNFAFVALVALGQTAVIVTAGIDLSVGSVLGLSGVVAGLVLQAGYPLEAGILAGVGVGALCGAVNGWLIAQLDLSPFVVTLAMLSIARSLALVVSGNRMVYEFGPDQDRFLALGGGSTLGLAHPLWLLLVWAGLFHLVLHHTSWGRHLYAVGGNESAALLNGVKVRRVKMLAYVLSGASAGLAAVLMVGWLGSVTNALGQGFELRVIAASVIGGANLMGGEGGAFGSIIGAALLEVIRNGLLLLGVDPYWQGTFVGIFILLAVLLEWNRRRRQ